MNGGSRPAVVPAGILGLGSYAPERVLSNADLERMVETSDEWILTRTGIAERRIAHPEEKTGDLACHAAARALADANVGPADVDLIITATVTPDRVFPATACVVQDQLGATRAGAFDLSVACSGFIYALAAGAQFVHSGTYRRVLVVGAETLSRMVNWRDRSTCVLFGDGAGAAVLGPVGSGQGFLSFDLGSDGSGADMLSVEPGGYGHPLTTGSDEVLVQSIRMAGAEVFRWAVKVLEESTLRSLERAGLSVSDLDCLIPHQANTRIIDAAVKRLGIASERVFNNTARYGNTSSASIPIALDEARAEGKVRPGDTVSLVGFGAGLAWASCVLRWTGSERGPARG